MQKLTMRNPGGSWTICSLEVPKRGGCQEWTWRDTERHFCPVGDDGMSDEEFGTGSARETR